ncbi:MAG: hypothetical protein AAB481_00175, partial [Patescibacteria group bacterium]
MIIHDILMERRENYMSESQHANDETSSIPPLRKRLQEHRLATHIIGLTERIHRPWIYPLYGSVKYPVFQEHFLSIFVYT